MFRNVCLVFCVSDRTCVNVQGSETLASWQANLLFEPFRFEVRNQVIVDCTNLFVCFNFN